MIRVGLVAEGPSDWLALEEMIRTVEPDAEFLHIRPDMTLASGSSGWKGVRAWCREMGPLLESFLSADPGLPLHLLVIHLDCTMAHNVGADHACPPADATSNALREVVTKEWLGRDSLPGFVVLATPSLSTDTWIAAALEPPYQGREPLECDRQAERELVRRRLLRLRDGEVKKSAVKYEPLAKQMGHRVETVCAICSEAARFRGELASAIVVLG
jgi:hypothetical protein